MCERENTTPCNGCPGIYGPLNVSSSSLLFVSHEERHACNVISLLNLNPRGGSDVLTCLIKSTDSD